MKPEEGQSTISLPITFDYNGGRGDRKKGNIIVAIVVTVIVILVTIGIIRNNQMPIGTKLLWLGGLYLLSMLLIRFRILKEATYSDAYETLKEIDYTPNTDSFWNIYEIDGSYPYVCHYKDGKHGIFVRMEKDVVVGKPANVDFLHYDAISEAYNLAGSLNMNMCQIDYMDNVGNDPRLRKLYENLQDVDNPDLKEMMLSIYSNLQDEMSKDYASFDVYLFTAGGNPRQLEYNVKLCIDRLLGGNYLTYKTLDIEGIRSTCMALFNLTEFSALDACDNIFKNTTFKGIVPIRVEHIDSTEELNKTQEELRIEREARLQAEAEAKRNKKSKFKKKQKKDVPDTVATDDDAQSNKQEPAMESVIAAAESVQEEVIAVPDSGNTESSESSGQPENDNSQSENDSSQSGNGSSDVDLDLF